MLVTNKKTSVEWGSRIWLAGFSHVVTGQGNKQADYDVIAVGAGFAGLGLIHYVREAGLSIRVFDKASDIGGTWTWNRYPGAASDSECYYYCLTFSKELLQEWTWSTRYPGWEENLRYMHFVADKCDMWPHITLNTKIIGAGLPRGYGSMVNPHGAW
ncbi:MAG: NAD(P)-binding protein [Steroidobacteraceae bacterium]